MLSQLGEKVLHALRHILQAITDVVRGSAHIRGLATEFFPHTIAERGQDFQHVFAGLAHVPALFFAHLAEGRIQALHLILLTLFKSLLLFL